jgi:hypothetical protein
MDLSEVREIEKPVEDRIDELSRLILVMLLLATLWHFA